MKKPEALLKMLLKERNKHVMCGLCSSVSILFEDNKIIPSERRFLEKLIKDEGKKQSVFYTAFGEEVPESHQFLWILGDDESRIKFLTEKIAYYERRKN